MPSFIDPSFSEPQLITDKLENELIRLAKFAPLHNVANMRAYEVCKVT